MVDRRNPQLVRVATVTDTDDHRILVRPVASVFPPCPLLPSLWRWREAQRPWCPSGWWSPGGPGAAAWVPGGRRCSINLPRLIFPGDNDCPSPLSLPSLLTSFSFFPSLTSPRPYPFLLLTQNSSLVRSCKMSAFSNKVLSCLCVCVCVCPGAF